MKRILTLLSLISLLLSCQSEIKTQEAPKYEKALVSYQDFKKLFDIVEPIREKRLISYEVFKYYQAEENTIVLDTRSRNLFASKHIQGAINLPYTEFTQDNLRALIPDTTTRILIYCNNNIKDDQIHFASKIYVPEIHDKPNWKPIKLALNVPTYVTLYGYGYRNIYELDELLSTGDPRVEFEGHGLHKGLSFSTIPFAQALKKSSDPKK